MILETYVALAVRGNLDTLHVELWADAPDNGTRTIGGEPVVQLGELNARTNGEALDLALAMWPTAEPGFVDQVDHLLSALEDRATDARLQAHHLDTLRGQVNRIAAQADDLLATARSALARVQAAAPASSPADRRLEVAFERLEVARTLLADLARAARV